MYPKAKYFIFKINDLLRIIGFPIALGSSRIIS